MSWSRLAAAVGSISALIITLAHAESQPPLPTPRTMREAEEAAYQILGKARYQCLLYRTIPGNVQRPRDDNTDAFTECQIDAKNDRETWAAISTLGWHRGTSWVAKYCEPTAHPYSDPKLGVSFYKRGYRCTYGNVWVEFPSAY
jgi:hypothetical protein